jgi:hypothetical protein
MIAPFQSDVNSFTEIFNIFTDYITSVQKQSFAIAFARSTALLHFSAGKNISEGALAGERAKTV